MNDKSPSTGMTCPTCGRRVDIRWPARSVVCSCGAQLVTATKPSAATATSPTTAAPKRRP